MIIIFEEFLQFSNEKQSVFLSYGHNYIFNAFSALLNISSYAKLSDKGDFELLEISLTVSG